MRNKHVASFMASLVLQLWFDVSAYSANNKVYALGIGVGLTYPFIAMIPMILMVEAESTRERLKLALSQGLGYAAATSLFFVLRDR